MARPAGSEGSARIRPGDGRRVEAFLGALLRGGVVVAATIVLVGGVLLVAHHGGDAASYATFRGEPDELRSPAGVVRGALALRGRPLVQLGLGVLVATPVLRVASSLVVFAWEKDAAYVIVSAIVLALLLLALAGVVA